MVPAAWRWSNVQKQSVELFQCLEGGGTGEQWPEDKVTLIHRKFWRPVNTYG